MTARDGDRFGPKRTSGKGKPCRREIPRHIMGTGAMLAKKIMDG
jgi:hypothetical protein